MDAAVVFWSRVQFAITNSFHYLYPPLSIGISLFLVIVGALYLKSKNPVWMQVSRFWTKVLALTFTIGVATGIPMEFQFGTNWANFSRYVGDVFGSALAAEGIFAFFLESGFLAVVVFGAGRVSEKFYFFSTVMVCLGAHFSAVWIVVANSWMQTPAGFEIMQGPNGLRAEITDFWAMVFNPSSVIRLTHTVTGCWLAGAFFVLSVSAWYLLKNKHTEFAKASMSVSLIIAALVSLSQLFISGHKSSETVAKYQPDKLAAMEGHWESAKPADLYIFGYIDEANGETKGLKIPGLTSWLITRDFESPVKGLDSVPVDERPPLQITFQSYHIMIAIGIALIIISLLGCFLWWKGKLFTSKFILWIFVFSVLGPMIANEAGWVTAEVGRQPWIVYKLMKTAAGVSPNITESQVIFSNAIFLMIYLMLFAVFIFVLNNKIQHGPEALDKAGPLLKLPSKLSEFFSKRRQDK